MFGRRRLDGRFGELLAGQGNCLTEAAELLGEMLAVDPAEQAALAHRLHECDHAAQAAAHAVLRALAESFVTPVDRMDLHRISWALRVAVGRIDAAGDEIDLYRLGALPSEVSELVQHVGRCAGVAAAAVPGLGRADVLAEHWQTLERLAKQAGHSQRQVLARVAGQANDPGRMVRLAALAQSLRRSVEAFEDLALALQTLAVREG